MPESAGFNPWMSDTALNDPSAVGYISIIGGHLYGTSPSYYANAVSKGKDVWMTEHFLNTASGSTPAMVDALALAEEIHNSMTVGQFNAYVWWGSGTNPYSVPLIDINNNPNYFGDAMGQFARFVRPGYLRVDATASPSAGIYLSAYSGSGHAVIVAINSNSTAEAFPITIQNQSVTSLIPYQTTATSGLTALSPISVTGDAFTAILPAQSITTFVQ
jgi:glucuronoarabinoxylan endo-1,4-beta-xylanase